MVTGLQMFVWREAAGHWKHLVLRVLVCPARLSPYADLDHHQHHLLLSLTFLSAF